MTPESKEAEKPGPLTPGAPCSTEQDLLSLGNAPSLSQSLCPAGAQGPRGPIQGPGLGAGGRNALAIPSTCGGATNPHHTPWGLKIKLVPQHCPS